MTDFKELRHKLMAGTKKHVQTEFGKNEIHIARASGVADDLESAFNLLFEHTKEWYHYHFPELETLLSDPENYLRVVHELGTRDAFSTAHLQEHLPSSAPVAQIVAAAQNSLGADISPHTRQQLQALARNALNLKSQRKSIENFLETALMEMAPNFTKLAGTMLAAKMIAHTGSLERLIRLPASALQVLGAENALFRHLRNKKTQLPPKHGYIFQHGLIRTLSADKRGRMARTLATKLALAIKTDYYNPTHSVAAALQVQLDKRFEAISNAPAKPIRPKPRAFSPSDFRPRFKPPQRFHKRFDRAKPRPQFHGKNRPKGRP